MPINAEILKKYPNYAYMELGLHFGAGMSEAIKSGVFQKFIGIEINDETYRHCVNIFKDNPNVTIIKGDSGKCLFDAIKFLDLNITIFDDSHWSGSGTSRSPDKVNPIWEDIDQIKLHHIKTHTVIVDDVRLMGTDDFCRITQEQIKGHILSINKDYKFHLENSPQFENDLLIAQVPKFS